MTRTSWLRGLIQRAGTTSIILVVALVATAAAAAGPIYYQAARTSILRDTLATTPFIGRGYEVNETGALPGLLAPLDRTQQQQLSGELGGPAGQKLFAAPILSLEGALVMPQDNTSIPLVWRTDACAHLQIRGSCPSARNQVVISGSTAALTGWRIGQQLHFSGEDPLTVTGVYQRPDQSLDYWFGRGLIYFPSTTPIDAMFTTRSTIEDGPAQAQGTAVVDELLRRGRVTGGEVAPLQAAMTAFAQSPELANAQILISTAIPATVQSVQANWRSLGLPVLLITLQLLALCLLLLFLSVTDAVEARAPEIALAKLRGRGAWSTAVFGLSEPLILLAVALPAGVLAGWGATALLSHVLLRVGTPVTLPGLAWAAGAAATVGGLAAAVLAARRTLRRPVLEEWRRSGLRMTSRGWVTDAVLGTAAAAGLLELFLTGQISSARPGTLILLVPGLLGLAVAVIASRLLPIACRAAYARTGRGGSLGGFLAIRHVGRRPGGARATMVLATAVALAVFAVSAWSVGHSNQQRVAEVDVGAPTVLTVSVPAGKDLGAIVANADPGGHQAAAVDSYTSTSSGNAGLAVLAVDPQRFADVAFWAARPGHPSLTALAAKLAPPAPAPVMLTGSAVRVTIQVKSLTLPGSSSSLPGSLLSADVTTGSSPINLGMLPAHGTATLTGALTGCPCVLQDFDLSPPVNALGMPVAGTVTITGLQVLQGNRWIAAGPRTVLTEASSWRPGHEDAPPDRIQAGASGITWTFSTRKGQDALLTSVNRPYPLPAVVSSALLSGGQTQATGIGLDGSPLSLQVVDAAVAVPSSPANGVIVDCRYAELAAGLAFPNASQQVWLAGDGQHAIEDRLQAAGVRVTSTSSAAGVAAQLARQGPALSSVLFLADAAAATLLAAGAAVLDLYLSARRRRYEYAALSASGVPHRTLRQALRFELALVLGFGGVVGAVTGAVAAIMTLRSVPEFTTSPPVSVLSYVPPAVPLIMLIAGAAALLSASALLASSMLVRGVSADQLREAPT